MMDFTPNKAMALDFNVDSPTLNVSVPAVHSFAPIAIRSEAYTVDVTQGSVPVVWPHPHNEEMNWTERQILHKALRSSVKIVGVAHVD